MKKLLTIVALLLLYINTIYSQPIFSNNTRNKSGIYELILSTVSKDLNLDSANIPIILSYSCFDKNLRDYEEGSMNKFREIYMINISMNLTKNENILVFIHELCHVSQIYHGDLNIGKNGVLYKGVAYHSNIPHDERQFEIDANNLTLQLFKKYKGVFKDI
jgi:hypothetical protein